MARQNLAQLAVGERASIARIAADTPVLRRLIEMGVTPGATVQLIRRAPLGDPIQVWLRGCYLTVRLRDAKEVQVTLCAKSSCAATPTAARPR